MTTTVKPPLLSPWPARRCPQCRTVLDGSPVCFRCPACQHAVHAADLDTEYHPPAERNAA